MLATRTTAVARKGCRPLGGALRYFSAALLTGCWGALALRAAEKSKTSPEVLVVASAIEGVPEDFRPSPGKPIYYILAKASITLGQVVGGIKLPDPETVERAVVSALAGQGFVRTQVGGPVPSIYLLVAWGDSNFANLDSPDPSTPPELQAAMDNIRVNRADRVKAENLVGTDKAEALGAVEGAKVLAASNEDRLYVSVAALDIPSLQQKKQKKLLWRTSMTIDGRNQLADALPAMLASGAPFFGVNSKAPVFLDEKDRRKTSVDIGELKVVPDAPPPEAKPAAKK